MNRDLYPDLTGAGGLGAALEQTAARLGIDLTVVPHEGGTLVTAGIASSVPHRKPLSMYIGAERRFFGVSGWSEGIEVITGATPDLAEVVQAGAAWGGGAGLREMRAQLPFLHFSERAEAYEHGPATVVELQWRTMPEQAAQAPDFP
ncbi:hypothetical protein GCM10010300_82530 [Streptomyces olivaceoviridis]|uniref:hypothetical protein n=1 Tax=Streptomyces olivaceoviridis TaxID=1921 RepID=UPI001672EB41|nr:hypothetical protein [Streptomyces olivaceoviridis]GGZ26703.1 hypothetical protein GCM10010300_82530 [Streptomyces olivaceoviridis]